MNSGEPSDPSKTSEKGKMKYWRGVLGDIVVQAETYEEAEKLIEEQIKDGDVPLLSIEHDPALDDPDYIFRDIDDEE